MDVAGRCIVCGVCHPCCRLTSPVLGWWMPALSQDAGASRSADVARSAGPVRLGVEDPVVAGQPPARVNDGLLAHMLEAGLPADRVRWRVRDPWKGVDVAPASVL